MLALALTMPENCILRLGLIHSCLSTENICHTLNQLPPFVYNLIFYQCGLPFDVDELTTMLLLNFSSVLRDQSALDAFVLK